MSTEEIKAVPEGPSGTCEICGKERTQPLHYEQINAAYKSGIKKCISIMLNDREPAKVTAMTKLMQTLYC